MNINRRQAIQSACALWMSFGSFATWGQARNFKVEARYALFDKPLVSHGLERFILESKLGYSYEIFVASPRKFSDKDNRPILYMLDGNAVFDRLSAQDLEQVPDLTIVGIGFPTPYTLDVVSRSRDYTPALPEGSKPYGRSGERPTGGADNFLLFVKEQLQPTVEKRCGFVPTRRAIWGHSFGGLFALYTLLKEPALFNMYLPVSPSTGWGDNLLQTLAKQVQPSVAWPIKQVSIMLGDQERKRNLSSEENKEENKPSPSTIELADLLRKREDINVNVRVLQGLGHGATFSASFPYALQEACS